MVIKAKVRGSVKISVCLATHNEEANIKDCLESVKWADEIVIVDGRSTDKTVEIARKYAAKIIIRENPLMFHTNKQKAFEAASGDWILYLDADERVSEKLKKEIQKTINYQFRQSRGYLAKSGQSTISNQPNGYWLPRKNIIFGKWIKNDFWYPDYQLRFFKRGRASLPCKSVHEQPELTGQAGYLKNPLVHDNYQTVSQFIQKLDRLYTENDAKLLLKKNKKIRWHDAIRLPVREFLATFFARRAYKDGLHGLVLSLFQAFSALVTFAKVWEAKGFEEQELPMSDLGNEFKKLTKETNYWLTDTLIKKSRDPVKKILLKFKRKLFSYRENRGEQF